MTRQTVYLIGGPPGAGKTTLGCAIARRIGGSSVTIDDLITFAHSFNTREAIPDLWLMPPGGHLNYYTNSTPEQLQADAERQHAAAWPAVQRLIERRTNKNTVPLVLDGWHLRPHRIAAMHALNLAPFWIHINPAVLEARERTNTDFLAGSPDPERMFSNFMSRSLWMNELLRDEAEQHRQPILHQDGTRSVEALCDIIMDR